MRTLSFFRIAAACFIAFAACTPDNVTDGNSNNNGGGDEAVKVDWSNPSWYSANFWERTDREKAGLRGPVKKWYESGYTTRTEYEYDRQGRLIKESYVDTEDAENNHDWIYTYDQSGHLIKKEYKNSFTVEGFADSILYEYENTGKFVAREWFVMGPSAADAAYAITKDLSWSLRVTVQPITSYYSEVTYSFNSDGNLVISESSYGKDNGSEEKLNEQTLTYTIVYQNGYPKSLDSDQLRFKLVSVSWYPNGMYKDFEYLEENSYNLDTGWDRYTYKMLDNPRYLAVESFDLGGKASYMSLTPKWMRKSYDEHFDIVRNDESYGDAPYSEGAEPTYTDTWKDYTYDKYGNWLTRIEHVIPRYTGEGYDRTVTRVLEYFE